MTGMYQGQKVTYAGKWRDCCYSGEYEDHQPYCDNEPTNARFADLEAQVAALARRVEELEATP